MGRNRILGGRKDMKKKIFGILIVTLLMTPIVIGSIEKQKEETENSNLNSFNMDHWSSSIRVKDLSTSNEFPFTFGEDSGATDGYDSFESKYKRNNYYECPEYVHDFFWIAFFEGELEYYEKIDKFTCYPVNVTVHGIFWYYNWNTNDWDLWYSKTTFGNWYEDSEFDMLFFIGKLTDDYIKGIAIIGHVCWID